jgi:mannuronan 5-epimerase
MIRCLIVVFSITVSLLMLVNMNILEFYGAVSASTQDSFQMSEEKTVCITYTNYKDVDESASTGNNLITINCKEPTNLTKVYENIKDPRVLYKEKGSNNTWILDASLIIEKGSTVVIDSADTKWLKILAGDNS